MASRKSGKIVTRPDSSATCNKNRAACKQITEPFKSESSDAVCFVFCGRMPRRQPSPSKKKSKKRSKDHAGVVCKKPKKFALALKASEASPGQVDNTWIDNLNKLTSELKKRNKKKRKKNKGK